MECVKENIWYVKRRKKFTAKRFLRLITVIAILFGVFAYFKLVVSETVVRICSDNAYAQSVKAVNDAVLFSFPNDFDYQNFVTIEKNSNGDVVYMSANAQKINSVSKNIAILSQKNLQKSLDNGVDIPFLTLSGIKLFSGLGAPINFNTVTISSVNCNFKSKFESAGINNTLHSIYAQVESVVNVDFALNFTSKTFITDVLICETVITGKVPDVYLNGDFLSQNA